MSLPPETVACPTCGDPVLSLEHLMRVAFDDGTPVWIGSATIRELSEMIGGLQAGAIHLATQIAHHAGQCSASIRCPASHQRLGAETGHCHICLQQVASEPVSPRHPNTPRFVEHRTTPRALIHALERLRASRC